jgi:hypothetical protein
MPVGKPLVLDGRYFQSIAGVEENRAARKDRMVGAVQKQKAATWMAAAFKTSPLT